MSTDDRADFGQLSFGTVAADYVRARPSYPAASVNWLLSGTEGPVADVGAGTGKLTAVIAETGRTVIAIDPDPDMLAAMPAGIENLTGTGEELPLPDASVGAVTFGQSWHWVDPYAGSREVARVLRPGGVLGLVWNVRDQSEEWVAELTRLAHAGAEHRMVDEGGPTVAAPFAAPHHHALNWTMPMSVDDIEAVMRSRSYLIKIAEPERERILADIRDFLATHPATSGQDLIEMPYVTHCYRYRADQ